jgi:hypothetical protein
MAAKALRARRESNSREESFQETMVDAAKSSWDGWGVREMG